MQGRAPGVPRVAARFVLVAAAGVAAALIAAAVAWAAKGELSFQERVPEFDVSQATSLTVSPDGKHLYATGSDAGVVTAFEVGSGGDDYTFIEAEVDGVDDTGDAGGTVTDIGGAADAAVSPDGKHLYVAGGIGSSEVAIFDRDATTGRLNFSDTVTDTSGDLTWPKGVAIDPGGDYVYATSGNDHTVLVFKRDSGDGSLTWVETEKDGVDDATDAGGTVDGLRGATKLAVAPDGDAVYVGTDIDDSLVAFERDGGTGKLSFVEFESDGVDDAGDPGGTVDGLNWVEDVLVSADNDNVYASSRFDDAVAVFDRSTATEELSFSEAEKDGVDDVGDAGGTVSGLNDPRGMALSVDDRNLYVAGNASDAVANFRRNATTGKLSFVEAETDGVNDAGDAGGVVDGLAEATAVAVGTDDGNVYAAAAAESGLAVFGRGAGFGRLSFIRKRPDFRISDPRGLAVSPNPEHLITTSLETQSVYSFERDPSDGTLELRDTETQGVDDPSDTGGTADGLIEPAAVTFSPDGDFVYVTDTSIYSISTFALDSATGELTWIETEADGVDDPTDSGGAVTGTYEPWSVAVSPDGGSVYAPGNSDDSLAAFSRDATTGKLNFVEAEFDGVGGVEGLEGADSVAVSPDGKHVYFGSRNDEAVVAFSRDASTSALTFVEAEQSTDQGGSVPALEDVDDIAVSADGKQVYAVGGATLWRFTRDSDTGELTLAETEEDGVDDPTDAGGEVSGLIGVQALELSADGEEVYAGGDDSPGSVAAFSRDPASGELSFLEAEIGGVDDPDDPGPAPSALGGISALAVSADDRFLYAAAEEDDGVAIFSREDDFDPPQTTITGGPANDGLTKDSTPSFEFSSSEAGSTFECSVDGGASGPCDSGETLDELSDGEHSFAVEATDAAGNTDPTPAERQFTVDTEVTKGKVTAKEKQKQKGTKIKVKIKLKAAEAAEALGKGEITVGKKSYKLKKKTKDLKPDKKKKLKLKPKKSKHKQKIADALKKGKKVKAKLTGKITDEAGNKFKQKPKVTLKRK